MKFKIMTASLVALSLFAAAAQAQDTNAPEGGEVPAVEQAPAPAVELPPEVMALMSDTRSPADLAPEELQNRFEMAQRFSQEPGLSPDIQQQLQQIARAARAELMARDQQQAAPAEEAAPQPPPAAEAAPAQEAAPPPPAAEAAPAQEAAPPPPAAEAAPAQEAAPPPAAEAAPAQEAAPPPPAAEAAPAQEAAPPAVAEEAQPEAQQQLKQRSSGEGKGTDDSQSAGALPPAVAQMLADERPVSSLNDQQLQRRIARLQQFSSIDGLSPDVAMRLQAMMAAAEQEVANRQQAQQPPAPKPPGVAEDPAAQPPVANAPPAPPPAPPPQVPAAELPGVQPTPPSPPPPAAADVKRLDSNEIDAATEERAKELMMSPDDIQQLGDDQLRRRVDDLRAVLATNELSPGMEREIRQQLGISRTVLRERVAAVEADRLRREQAAQNQNRPRNRYWAEEAPADWDWAIRDVLNDRRRSEDLRIYELRRRLEVMRQAVNDRRYGPEYRAYWRAVIDRDQYVLGLRLVELRRKRQAQIDDLYSDDDLDFEIGVTVAPDEDVFVAEVDDERLQDVLISKPRKKFNRRFTVEEIEQNDEVRAALPRVEVDTVKFGFNEAFVRPEEIDKLDRIGELLERILQKNPREVFLIEGHTDAVGSDAANLALSRKRAEAVKKALTTYFVIPAKALRTAGYGERLLKIPTAEAEAENRRVSVSRATELIGQLQ